MDRGEEATMLTEAPDDEPIVARVAASEIGKAELMC
jgi:hypothetical protein